MAETDQDRGLDVPVGEHHYRAYVGPPGDYDLIGGLTFSLLVAAGLRETHRLLDLGCGSLRAGRLLMPYLRPGHYYGIEPHQWLVEEGIDKECGRDLVELKRPTFRYVDDFSATGFGVAFDFVVAQSVFSHSFPDLTAAGFHEIAQALAPTGVVLATYLDAEDAPPGTPGVDDGSGWVYPGCVAYDLPQIRALLHEQGLVARRVNWPHPRQRWVVAGHDKATVERIAATVRSPHRPAPG